MTRFAWLMVAAMIASLPASAHEVSHAVTRAEAVVIHLTFADGSPFAYEECEIRRDGETTAFAVLRTDAEGRVAFVPPTAGTYHARALAQDGHGASFSFVADDLLVASSTPAGSASRDVVRLALGVGLILLLFVGLRLLTRSRSERTS